MGEVCCSCYLMHYYSEAVHTNNVSFDLLTGHLVGFVMYTMLRFQVFTLLAKHLMVDPRW